MSKVFFFFSLWPAFQLQTSIAGLNSDAKMGHGGAQSLSMAVPNVRNNWDLQVQGALPSWVNGVMRKSPDTEAYKIIFSYETSSKSIKLRAAVCVSVFWQNQKKTAEVEHKHGLHRLVEHWSHYCCPAPFRKLCSSGSPAKSFKEYTSSMIPVS